MRKLVVVTLLFTISMAAVNYAAPKKPDNQSNVNSTKEVKMEKNPQYEITVSQSGNELGKIIIETFPAQAPKHSANFDSLVSIGFYDGTAFHRVIPGFMIQGGDPNTKNFPNDRDKWGMGDPSQTMVPAEFNKGLPNWTHKRGILSAARRGDNINSATSQFFIMHKDSPHLDGQYSIYGQVLEGMDVVDKIATTPRNNRDAPNETITMKIKRIDKENKKK